MFVLESHPRAGEDDPIAVWRPGAVRVARHIGQLMQTGSVGSDQEKFEVFVAFAVAGKDDPISLARPLRKGSR